MNLKDLSGTTILLAMLYFTAYGFYSGFSDFFGFPTSFISIGVPELVKYSVVVTGIIFSLLALLHFDTEEKHISFFVSCFFIVLAGGWHSLCSTLWVEKGIFSTTILGR